MVPLSRSFFSVPVSSAGAGSVCACKGMATSNSSMAAAASQPPAVRISRPAPLWQAASAMGHLCLGLRCGVQCGGMGLRLVLGQQLTFPLGHHRGGDGIAHGIGG